MDNRPRLKQDLIGHASAYNIRTRVSLLAYRLAHRFARALAYRRHPFVRYPYMNPPGELLELTKQLLSVQAPGIVVEVGCHQGWTTCFLLEALIEQKVKRDYVCIDTFSGFTSEDLKFEHEVRGKAPRLYDGLFLINDPEWLKAALSHSGYTNVSVRKADAATFDYRTLGPIAFAFVDLDLFRPVRESLERILPNMAPGGVIVVDDCNSTDTLWDGAYHAYSEICREHNIESEIICEKLGIIRA
jgi:O-methyltransferase